MTDILKSPLYQEIFLLGQRQERLSSIELVLEVKFGNDGLSFMPNISEISDFEQLGTIYLSILTLETLEKLKLVMENL